MSSDGTTILFGLPGVRVHKVVRAADGVRVVHVITDDETAAACPACGVFSTSVRQRRTTHPRDLPYGEAPLAVRWHKIQYACAETACDRRAFTEQITELPARARVTGRLLRHVAGRVGDGLPVSGACAGLMSWPIAHAAFVTAAAEQLAEPEPVAVLGIDETRRGRPRWTRKEDGEGWVKLEGPATARPAVAGPAGPARRTGRAG
ncbi:zinc-finger of transposase IS204/IS1001/IS1096/IS1165 [Modestobacter sp. DSM 44400]|uniref:transposase family protein n=1 Tax=Modestobacter sp. DSM 44400 TaxID=1550230 RepID=UPI00089CB506|nr:transposase family protein [Modestobacter sp. DSM 44400]SDY74780.1 zinc-finger of transposase IS204/IS1001/IS1096/IS1165 [Modestobacter sp. DSM 44400]